MFKKKELAELIENSNGRVAVPIMLYLLGVPGIFVFILWVFFFRG